MEVVLLIIAGVVLYMLYNGFQDYMKNPYKINKNDNDYKTEYDIKNNPYIELTQEEKIIKTEYGILTCILKGIASSDGKVCKLEQELISNILDDIANELSDFKDARESLQKIFNNDYNDLDSLAQDFINATKGEYKKRLKVIEFLFAIAYADGTLDDREREKIIDIAAIFELNNDDFNKIYDDFENMYNTKVDLDRQKALDLLNLNENYSQEDLENAYKEKVKTNKQNIFRSLNKKLDTETLRDIDEAYKILNKKDEIKLIKDSN
ncbi:TerB family tellurite resistance protein [Helicobacter sp. MIT 14-3879]|uniref:TerB family tellurite resistance protein n=1 Tax=Helicobacter sp. MIT 14-3879 TaxID=2040649 RepID=UPI000E1E3F17|nr:TerB family tellurite resistance protein [Helicobacter sp. MIT 14-3879]RDU62624.1 molecular chaperone DnaJ [Helicobacter sp. MIT 14-3879]